MKTKHPAWQWVIYAIGGGWCAWNMYHAERIDFDARTFVGAVDEFEKQIGPYYSTR